MSKAIGFLFLVFWGWANLGVSAYGAELTLFKCDFVDGGKVVASRDSHHVKIAITENGKTEKIVNPLGEAGVSTAKDVEGYSVDLLDVIQGDVQYSLAYRHGKMLDVAKLMVFQDNKPDVFKDCKLETTVNNLADPASIAGIFKP